MLIQENIKNMSKIVHGIFYRKRQLNVSLGMLYLKVITAEIIV